ncbi:FmdE family protein [Pseudorhodoplanes sp.]|uniref:FmdE family protein n=1 Tax=Pseudorhodoplanes sp. TaxID=1934341 RepID=UPI00391D5E50
MRRLLVLLAVIHLSLSQVRAETAQDWATLGARVHGGYGAFIPLGVKIGLDAREKLKAGPRELSVLYFDNPKAPCACFADGIAIATVASPGQRSLVMASEQAPDMAAAVIVIRPRKGGPGLKYTIPMASLPRLAEINKRVQDPVVRHDAVMKMDGLFAVTAAD